MKKLILFLILLVQLFALKPWFLCRNFIYHFSMLDLNLQLIDAIHTDYGPILVTRIFHNKPVFFILDIYRRYLHFIDVQLLTVLLSLVGIFGFISGLWYFLNTKKKEKVLSILILWAFIFPLLEIIFDFKLDFPIKLGIFWFPFVVISTWGHWKFISSKKLRSVVFIYLILMALSVGLLISYPNDAFLYCYKP